MMKSQDTIKKEQHIWKAYSKQEQRRLLYKDSVCEGVKMVETIKNTNLEKATFARDEILRFWVTDQVYVK